MERRHTDDGIQQRLESPAVTLTATVTGMRVHKHHQSCIFKLYLKKKKKIALLRLRLSLPFWIVVGWIES